MFDAVLPPPTPPTEQCIIEESRKQSIPVMLTLAILKTEGGTPGLVKQNKNGRPDYGPMQVNEVWMQEFADVVGMKKESIRTFATYHGCTNVAMGAYILRKRINEANGDIWKGVASYRSKTPSLGHPYAWKVHKNMMDLYKLSVANTGTGKAKD